MPFEQDRDRNAFDFRQPGGGHPSGGRRERLALVEPYRSEIRPHWRYRTPRVARASADAIYALYLGYRNRKDLVGMDMARRYLRLGYMRARRSSSRLTARSAAPADRDGLLLGRDGVKAEAAVIFRSKWQLVRTDPEYGRLRRERQRPED